MPRSPRIKSNTKVYHCMLRGINKQDIFFDNQDYLKFIKEMKRTKETFHYSLYSYVLMPNHVHLQIKDENENLSKIMHSIQISYSRYFNKKYERVGHVFQDRYNSKPVENDIYLLKLCRYIHQNPEKAGIDSIENYKWSSYKEYIYAKGITDTEKILNMFDNKRCIAKKLFIEYNQKEEEISDSEEFLEYEIKSKLTDQELIYFLKAIIKLNNIQEVQKYNKEYRQEFLKEIKNIKGTNIQQISRVLGISQRLIKDAIK